MAQSLLAVLEAVELNNKSEDREGNAGTNIDSINHTDVELVTVVWLDV